MKKLLLALAITSGFLSACSGDNRTDGSTSSTDTAKQMHIAEAAASYSADSVTAASFVAYDDSRREARPVVLIIPEWWGLGDYVKMRARELAKLGYFAMAVDMYGGGRTGDDPDAAGKLAGPFYADDALVRSRISAALGQIRNYPQADSSRMAIMGYCFGGTMSLKAAKLGLPFRGAVSIHGGLAGTANKNMPILVLHGGADSMVPDAEVAAWRKSMDSLGATYTFRSYPGATHAFSNPNATEKGKQFKLPIEYNPAADSASWKELQQFLGKVL